MSNFIKLLRDQKLLVLALIFAFGCLSFLMLYRLGSLTNGISSDELKTAAMPYGWHGLYHNPLYLPINVIRSIFFKLFPHYGQTIIRAPSVLFGCLAIVSFAYLIWIWHGMRTAILATILFATSAWTLHVSRLGTNDIMYLFSVPTLLLLNTLLHRHFNNAYIFIGTLCVWGLLLYIPGLIWLLIFNIFWERKELVKGWLLYSKVWQRIVIIVTPLIWLPLLANYFRSTQKIEYWLGHMQSFGNLSAVLKSLIAVPIHLFVRGPEYPQLWLGRAPVLDIFALAMTLLGIFFYVTHFRANRSKMIGFYALIAWLLTVFGSSTMFSLLVPLAYVCAAAGIAFLIRDWLRVFPTNPLARGLGVGLIVIAVAFSSFYNVRSYYIAWTYNPTTQALFRDHLH